MSTIVKVQHKGQVTIPARLRIQAGLVEGDLVEATFQQGRIILTPKAVIDRSQFPNADDEYTPAQRRVIDARLAKAHADIKAGRLSPVFTNQGDLIAHLHKVVKKRGSRKTSKRPA